MKKKNIIVVGYPKSGTNWLGGLIADLVEGTYMGNWGFSAKGDISQGSQGHSGFQIYKSHHSFNDLFNASHHKIDAIIYLIRDPRDISISGLNYFSFSHPLLHWIKKLGFHNSYRKLRTVYSGMLNERMKKKKMIHAVIYGNEKISFWLKIPWEMHYNSYVNKDILFIKYENVLDFPERECKIIVNHLNLIKTDDHIKGCVESNEFIKRKNEAHRTNNIQHKKLLRKGSYGYWKEEFSAKEVLLFKNSLKSDPDFYEF